MLDRMWVKLVAKKAAQPILDAVSEKVEEAQEVLLKGIAEAVEWAIVEADRKRRVRPPRRGR